MLVPRIHEFQDILVAAAPGRGAPGPIQIKRLAASFRQFAIRFEINVLRKPAAVPGNRDDLVLVDIEPALQNLRRLAQIVSLQIGQHNMHLARMDPPAVAFLLIPFIRIPRFALLFAIRKLAFRPVDCWSQPMFLLNRTAFQKTQIDIWLIRPVEIHRAHTCSPDSLARSNTPGESPGCQSPYRGKSAYCSCLDFASFAQV
ncbi:hypothetical protein AYI68_g5741 [Smittium mucronatum]|uniref:Uncharacterized protein n=1 Tax=Smittium mucronatum TaxID=133383 RepID=A0A1R0GTE9_9FUNG|nr:hypothetical protein AYI68_g5741 [Smittium mucronatum]